MVLGIPVSTEIEAKSVAKATAAGVDVTTFAAKELERAAMRLALEQVLAPLRAQFDQRGMSDEELTEYLEQAKHEARAQRTAQDLT